MNYIVLNGQKSTTIQGLLISELPPISKPLMRTQKTEIDGRDGDIITKLGYAAYDKELEIGLYGDFKIDNVIEYFNSEGTVIFSNEPDKYYNYQILDDIDFDRLVRFRTAKVILHVQPFKYSAVDQIFSQDMQLLNLVTYSFSRNGVTVESTPESISITGTSNAATEFYIPITPLSLMAGSYTLTINTAGTVSGVSARLIGTAPSNNDSFGGGYIALKNDGAVTLQGQLTEGKIFNYLWLYVNNESALSATVTASVMNNNGNSATVINRGNVIAKPQLTLYGSGTVNLSLNGNQIFIINIGSFGYITIDAAQMNAYQGQLLLNRNVVGDYKNLVLNPGTNIFTWTGSVDNITITEYSRWL